MYQCKSPTDSMVPYQRGSSSGGLGSRVDSGNGGRAGPDGGNQNAGKSADMANTQQAGNVRVCWIST